MLENYCKLSEMNKELGTFEKSIGYAKECIELFENANKNLDKELKEIDKQYLDTDSLLLNQLTQKLKNEKKKVVEEERKKLDEILDENELEWSISEIYDQLGDNKTSLEILNKKRIDYRLKNNILNEAKTMQKIGFQLIKLGEIDNALQFFTNSIQIIDNIHSVHQKERLISRLNLGKGF